MRLRFWEPADWSNMPGARHLSPRRMNLTELDEMARAAARAVGAETYVLTHQNSGKVVGLDDVEHTLDSQLSYIVTAERPAPADGTRPGDGSMANMPGGMESSRVQLQVSTQFTCTLSGDLREHEFDALERTWDGLGSRRRDRAWIYPTLFLMALAAVVAPLVVLWARGDLTLWLIPMVVGLVVLTFTVVPPHLQNAVRRERSRRSGLDFDLRPIARVRSDREQKRQRRQAAIFWAVLASLPAAAIGAAAQALWN